MIGSLKLKQIVLQYSMTFLDVNPKLSQRLQLGVLLTMLIRILSDPIDELWQEKSNPSIPGSFRLTMLNILFYLTTIQPNYLSLEQHLY